MTRRHLLLVATLAAILSFAPGVQAYLKLAFANLNGQFVQLKWTRMPVRYYVTNRDAAGVTASQLQAVADKAFRTWAAPSGSTISSGRSVFKSS